LFDAKESLELQRASGDSLVHLLYQDSKTAKEEARARIDLVTVDSELITYFKRNPERMYQLDPNKFEELVAALLKDLGYDIELTKPGPDGGIDIIATQKTGVGEMLLLVDCKRYAPRRPVGVGIVRALFGITEQLRASMGLLATTSFFTKPAREFQKTVRHRISLKDYSDLIGWLNLYGAGMHR
jgi:restriction system protein